MENDLAIIQRSADPKTYQAIKQFIEAFATSIDIDIVGVDFEYEIVVGDPSLSEANVTTFTLTIKGIN